MLRKFAFLALVVFAVIGCEMPTEEVKEVTTVNNVSIVWKGSRATAPSNPAVGWAYYNTTLKKAYIWDGDSWEILAQDGVSIIWKGELPSAPASPQTNWAYYNIIDGNSYIYNGYRWDLLAKAGRDGATGILLWLGTLASAPSEPSAGWAYHDDTAGVSYIWDGDSWEVLVRDGQNGSDGSDGTDGNDGVGIVWQGALSTAPSDPQTNWGYFNTNDDTSYIWDGDSWEILAESGSATIMVPLSWQGSLTSAPPNPQIGWMYYNTVLGKSYVWDGSAWNIVAQDGTSPSGFLITWKGALSTAPSNPQQGWAYYNTTAKKSYLWDGNSWQILARDGADGAGGGTAASGPWLYVILYTSAGQYQQYNTTTLFTASFGKVGVGSSARSTTFYIGLLGGTNATLNLTGSPAIQVSGENADCFSVAQPSTTSTNSGTYITDASITFTPDSTGEKIATITIPNDSPDYPDFSFTVTGTGSLWPKTFDGGEGDGDDQITRGVIDSAGNLYLVGYGFELVNHHSGYDWWIKKIDASGNEVTSGWNKKLDFYDNYSTSYTQDRPSNAIIDGQDNLIVSDGYHTVKFASSGTEAWRKSVGGTLYVDSANNVFVVTSSGITKYDSAGTEQWTKAYTGKLAFDESDSVLVYSGSTMRKITADGTVSWATTSGDYSAGVLSNGWYNGSITALDACEYWKFSVTSGKTYAVALNNGHYASYGDGTKTGYVEISAYYESDGSSIFATTASAYSTPKTFTATENGYVVVKVELYSDSSSYFGTYAVAFNEWYGSGASITDGWYDGSLETNGSETKTYSVTAGKRYFVAWNSAYEGDGSKTGNINVSAYWEDDEGPIFSGTHGGWNTTKSFLATRTGTVVVKAQTYTSSSSYAGSYAVVLKEAPSLSCDKIIPQTINSAVFDSSGNIYTAGYGTASIDAYSKKDVWIKKFDPSGAEISSGWNKKYDWGHSDEEYAAQIFSRDGNLIVIGRGNDLFNGSSKDDTWVKKFTTSGAESAEFVIPDNDATLITIDSSENYYFSSGSTTSALFRKYDASGSLVNSYSWNSKSPYIYGPSSSRPGFVMDAGDNVYMYGYASNLVSPESGCDWIVKKFNSAGVEQ